MSLYEILETIFIGPLKLIFEIIFVIAERFTGHAGIAIIALSLIMNTLVLPLYRRADAIQEEAKNVDEKLRDGIAHIKKTFTGDERMMILQAYYRQNNYKPTDALKGSVSLLLEVPFFMAAYQLLSGTPLLNGVAMGPIADLGAPDGLLNIGGVCINVLPFVMTGVNFISSAIYLKGYPLKTKIQLYGMALFFLVFLYTSPSGLVFYWTLNNLYSLVKTLFYKLKNPGKVLAGLCALLGVGVLGFGIAVYHPASVLRKVLVIGIGFAMLLPIVVSLLKNRINIRIAVSERKPDFLSFLLSGLACTALVGLLIPCTFISASPQEYIDPSYFHDPMWYVISALCFASGLFLVWMTIFYWLTAPKFKPLFEKIVTALVVVMLINYMFFGTDLGMLFSNFTYENNVIFSMKEQLVNILVIGAAAALTLFAATKWKNAAKTVLLTVVAAMVAMSVWNMVTINKYVTDAEEQISLLNDEPLSLELSKDGKNVVVIMLDRAMGEYIPYILQEKPELAEQYDGFTYYANTISHGGYTNFGVPGLYGGYEYTPVEMNKRSEESLASKHDEALTVMPVLFSRNGFDVTVLDPPYSGYQWIPDLSVFENYPEIRRGLIEGMFISDEQYMDEIDVKHRNVFCFSLMKTLPVSMQPVFYSSGSYNRGTGTQTGLLDSTWPSLAFMKSYETVRSLPSITKVTQTDANTFLSMCFSVTHEFALLQTPDYTPSNRVDNTGYEQAHADWYTADGITLHFNNDLQLQHYHANMGALLRLGEWLDVLRQIGVYDNTRIIIASDHGRDWGQIDELLHGGEDSLKDAGFYFPLLMVKDYNSTGFTVSHEFMTNADVPALATQGLIDSPVNPFTGIIISMDEKFAHEQLIILSHEWDVNTNNGNTYLPARWASVHDDLWNGENWTFYDQETVLTEHSLPE